MVRLRQRGTLQKDSVGGSGALAKAKTALGEYRALAKIDGPDGGMVVPENTAEGRGGAPDAQYVVPVFSGGAAMAVAGDICV